MPFPGYRPDHRAGIELATIDAHRAAEAVTDLERRLDGESAPNRAPQHFLCYPIGLGTPRYIFLVFHSTSPQSTHPHGISRVLSLNNTLQ
jgi:hypothetical protein